ncbi:MAG: transcriptional regulator [Armatimonadetes bacterium]|nr:transcriptional regulator [Armatimonadota bacterium]
MIRLSTSQQEILRLLRRSGELTVEDLARAMRITSVAVRQHLEPLLADGYVTSRTQRGAIGRPCHLYRLTDAADDLFSKGYANLALMILEHIEAADGPAKIEEIFRSRRTRMEAEVRPGLEGQDLELRVRTLARAQEEAGYMAEWERIGEDAFLIREHNCAICKVARRFPQACEQELQMFHNLLDADVERTHHRVSGDSMCCYLIRPRRLCLSTHLAIPSETVTSS